MTPQGAIEIIKIAIADVEWNYPMEYVEAFETAIAALRKHTPEKIMTETEDDREFVDFVCPNCKTILQQKQKHSILLIEQIYKYKHCIHCGQALDWWDEE